MSEDEKIMIPDIGGAEQVDVIEVLVEPGDVIQIDDPLITLEGDKATMEVPSPISGKVSSISIKVGDKVSEGDLIVEVSAAQSSTVSQENTSVASKEEPTQEVQSSVVDQCVPDIGGANDVSVIEVMIQPGDQVAIDDALITLEGDKATMEVPAMLAGKVAEVAVKVGDTLSEGDLICRLESVSIAVNVKSDKPPMTEPKAVSTQPVAQEKAVAKDASSVHASPAVRRLAREFDINLQQLTGTAPKGRISKEDIQNFVKRKLAQANGAGGVAVASPMPSIDFSKFGAISSEPLSKIKKASGAGLHRNWVSIPHVTQFADATITEMERFRKEQKGLAEQKGVKLTPVVFVMKAVVAALKQFPLFNASLEASGDSVVLKHYYHLGVAVNTDSGLVVPVIRDVDQKSIFELAGELGEISQKARAGKLSMSDMQGGCFTISSLGGIGGTAFTPIINAPEVAILGLSRSERRPVYQVDGSLAPELILPLSLSYDHRVIDGVQGAEFIMYLSRCLADIRMLLL